jgi:imidazolonepropionase-like amidohydrolase
MVRWGKDAAERRSRFEEQLRLVGAMKHAGVRILAGSDTPNPYVFPGISLHEELALLVKAGLSATEALCAATIRPAEFLGRLDHSGSIAPGKDADLVLLDGNPLLDIANTRRISAVILKGKPRRL